MRKGYDLFLSHTSKDKLEYVNGLYKELSKLGVNIFFDRDSISWGDNLKQKILDGTANSEFAIIVISKNFFGREWTEKELIELLSLQNDAGQKIVLPLLYNVSPDQVIEHYPELKDILYISAKDYTKPNIAMLFAKELIKRLKEDIPTKEIVPLVIEAKGNGKIFRLLHKNSSLLALDVILVNPNDAVVLLRDIEVFMSEQSGTRIQSNRGGSFVEVLAQHYGRNNTYRISATPNPVPTAIDGNSTKEFDLLFEFSDRNIRINQVRLKIMTSTDVIEIPLSVAIV